MKRLLIVCVIAALSLCGCARTAQQQAETEAATAPESSAASADGADGDTAPQAEPDPAESADEAEESVGDAQPDDVSEEAQDDADSADEAEEADGDEEVDEDYEGTLRHVLGKIAFRYDEDHDFYAGSDSLASIYFDPSNYLVIQNAGEMEKDVISIAIIRTMMESSEQAMEGRFEEVIVSSAVQTTVDDNTAFRYEIFLNGGKSPPFEGDFVQRYICFIYKYELYVVVYTAPEDTYEQYYPDYLKIVNSISAL